MTVITRALLLAVLIAGADYAYQKWRTDKQLKMSKDDVKREHKNTEGDPHIKGQRRRRQQEMSRNRMLGSVATADVVVTNPTHFAVALGYAPGDPAPRVLAKGTNRLALKIRREAHRNGVPVHEDRPTARALYRQVRIGGYVPASLFEAVAVVLAVAYRRTGRVPTTRQSAA
jgi:flagellar biosynthetic protein FlhB